MRLHAGRLTLVIGFLTLAALHGAVAQRPASTVVRVHVTDTTRAALTGVDLGVVKNGTEVVLIGQTDAAGRYTFRFEPDSGRYRLVVRKLGYVQTARLLAVAPSETLTVELSLARLPPALDTIRAAAERLPLAKQPFVGAAEIERDTRAVFLLKDVLKKLRPDINYQGAKCPSQSVGLVRGRPILARPRYYANGQWIPPEFKPDSVINAEHILELRWVPCLDESIPGLPPKAWPSVYVTLKPGVAWSVKLGSYVADSATYEAAGRCASGAFTEFSSLHPQFPHGIHP